MHLLDITERVSALSQHFLARNDIPDFKSIKGMRNRLVHGYSDVGFDYIADAIFDDLPVLVDRCNEILAEFEQGSKDLEQDDSNAPGSVG